MYMCYYDCEQSSARSIWICNSIDTRLLFTCLWILLILIPTRKHHLCKYTLKLMSDCMNYRTFTNAAPVAKRPFIMDVQRYCGPPVTPSSSMSTSTIPFSADTAAVDVERTDFETLIFVPSPNSTITFINTTSNTMHGIIFCFKANTIITAEHCHSSLRNISARITVTTTATTNSDTVNIVHCAAITTITVLTVLWYVLYIWLGWSGWIVTFKPYVVFRGIFACRVEIGATKEMLYKRQ